MSEFMPGHLAGETYVVAAWPSQEMKLCNMKIMSGVGLNGHFYDS